LSGKSRRQLLIALALTSVILVVEAVASFMTGSLALLSDAAHMATDAAALGIALLAVQLGTRKADTRRSYGYRRLEILAAALNAGTLFIVGGYILWEAVGRFRNPEPIATTGVIVVAAIGLVINAIAMATLHGSREHSLNIRGAYLEVWADFIGSVGVLVGAASSFASDSLGPHTSPAIAGSSFAGSGFGGGAVRVSSNDVEGSSSGDVSVGALAPGSFVAGGSLGSAVGGPSTRLSAKRAIMAGAPASGR